VRWMKARREIEESMGLVIGLSRGVIDRSSMQVGRVVSYATAWALRALR
jgi:hypothetical protein